MTYQPQDQNEEASRDGFIRWWSELSPLQQEYFYLKARYYKSDRKVLGLLIFLLVLAVGVLVYLQGESVVTSLIIFVIGVVLGVIINWEIERRKRQ